MKKIRVIELFAGYGSQHLALKRLKRDYPEFEYEVVAFCEIDENAIKAYHALHGDHIPNLGDITQVNPSDVPDCDLMTWSFPCQSISSAGLQHGLAEGSGTRSSLCWNAVRIFEAKRPKYLLMENVSALVSDKFIGDFNLLQSSLQKIGYTNFTQLMNAKDYGVPQNRLRIFMVSILDCQRAYYFPKPFKLERRLKDVLEQNVEERYYLSEEQVAKLISATQKPLSEPEIDAQIGILGTLNPVYNHADIVYNKKGIAPAITAAIGMGGGHCPLIKAEPQDNVMLGWTRSSNGKGEPTYHPVKVANCVTAAKRDNTQNYVMEPTICGLPHGHYKGDLYTEYAPTVKSSAYAANNPLLIPQATKEGYAVVPEGGVFDASYPDSTTRRGRVQEGGTVSPTIMASQNELLRYEGRELEPYDCIYYNQSPDFQRPPLKNIGRTVKADSHQPAVAIPVQQGIRIRRLTERELYRLMDVEEKDIDTLLNAGISNTQLAKLAGNSVVCACYYHIFHALFIETTPPPNTQTQLF